MPYDKCFSTLLFLHNTSSRKFSLSINVIIKIIFLQKCAFPGSVSLKKVLKLIKDYDLMSVLKKFVNFLEIFSQFPSHFLVLTHQGQGKSRFTLEQKNKLPFENFPVISHYPWDFKVRQTSLLTGKIQLYVVHILVTSFRRGIGGFEVDMKECGSQGIKKITGNLTRLWWICYLQTIKKLDL